MCIKCSKGIYICFIVDDLGQNFGCGVYVICLYCMEVVDYFMDKMVLLDKLIEIQELLEEGDFKVLDDLLIFMDIVVSCLLFVIINDVERNCFDNG